MKKYLINFSQESWRCGDGCCSDSWYTVLLYVFDPVDNGYVLFAQWDNVRSYFGNDGDSDKIEWTNERLKEYGIKIILTSENCDVE